MKVPSGWRGEVFDLGGANRPVDQILRAIVAEIDRVAGGRRQHPRPGRAAAAPSGAGVLTADVSGPLAFPLRTLGFTVPGLVAYQCVRQPVGA